MRLGDLVPIELQPLLSDDERAIDITGLTADSRKVERGFLFAALAGTKLDGATFIPEAVARGAAAVLRMASSSARPPRGSAVLLQDRNPRRSFAVMAARFFGAQPDIIVAVTGTNGKTSVATFTRQIWERLGLKAASIGTLGVQSVALKRELGLTTPDPVALHQVLAELKRAGVEHVAVEASSHGLAQNRLDGVEFAGAAITNLTRDHLDYHRDFEEYAYAKLRLFGEVLPPGSLAVIAADSEIAEEARALAWARGHRVINVGRAGSDIGLIEHAPEGMGQRLAIAYQGRRYAVSLPLAGLFQASNALVAAGLAIGTGASPEEVFAALAHLKGAPGRLELVARARSGAPVYVDYAHTPDALLTVLEALRPHVRGRLHLVFGCGGDRDRGKRPEMGRIAAAHADRVIVTDDNPRSEDPAAIRKEILAAAPGASDIGDRKVAIERALAALGADDLLVIAGKGHETGQIVGQQTIPFNDADIARRAVDAMEAAS
jgi:UDP-N-acetylmuramoyl-L-alanyl-D-glutamate--2,6-diaminopimelate ligase